MKKKIYKDSIHGFEAVSNSKTGAWMLIRNKCHELGLEVPTLDKIIIKRQIMKDLKIIYGGRLKGKSYSPFFIKHKLINKTDEEIKKKLS